MLGEQFEIRLYKERAEVHYGSRSTLAFTPPWSHVQSVPGGGFPEAVAVVREVLGDPGAGLVCRYAWLGPREARLRKRFDIANEGGRDVVVNSYQIQLRPKGWAPEPKGQA